MVDIFATRVSDKDVHKNIRHNVRAKFLAGGDATKKLYAHYSTCPLIGVRGRTVDRLRNTVNVGYVESLGTGTFIRYMRNEIQLTIIHF